MSNTLIKVPGPDYVIFSERTRPVLIDQAERIIRKHPQLRTMLEERWERLVQAVCDNTHYARPLAYIEFGRLMQLEHRFSKPEWPALYHAHQRIELSLNNSIQH